MRGIFLAAILLATPALAHDHGNPELDAWFRSLQAKNGVSCCDGQEAMRLDDIDWDAKDGHYRVKMNNQWVDVPDGAVIEQPNRSGPAMVWPYYLNGQLMGIRCFIPGSGT